MRKSRFLKRMIAVVLLIALSASMTVSASSNKSKAENTSLSEAQEEMNKLEKQLKEAKGLVSDLKESKGNVEKKISQLNANLIQISAYITELENQLTAKNVQIVETQAQLKTAQEVAAKQYEDMKMRIQYMYENGQFSYAEAFLASDDVSDFLNSAEYINKIQEYDRQKLDEYKNTIAEIETIEAQLEQEKSDLETIKADVEKEKQEVASLMNQKENELSDIKDDLSDAQDEADVIAAEVQAQKELIAEIIRIEAEKAANGESSSPYAGTFTWPCPSSKRVTSDYGPRTSPTAGASSDHKGIDIGASTGSDIVAAAPGKVIVSRYSSSAGYYITIDHGGGLYTVYMHCSKLIAACGDVVTAGQVIAKVGSTGISTGPHLHFGVSLNGSYVSPWGYLTKP